MVYLADNFQIFNISANQKPFVMATRTAKKTNSNKKDQSRYNEVIGIVLSALAVLLLLCLVTASETDPNLNTATTWGETQNWIGVVGAIVADVFFQIFGSMAYILPFLLGLIGIRFLFSKTLYTPPARIIGIFLFVITGASLFSLLGFRGGITGEFFAEISISLLNIIGTGILLITLFLTSLILITNFSYASFLESYEIGWGNFKMRFDEWLGKYRQMKTKHEQTVLEKQKDIKPKTEKPETIEKPKIVTPEKDLVSEKREKFSDKFSSVLKKLSDPPVKDTAEKPAIIDKSAEEKSQVTLVSEKAESAEIEKPIEKVNAATAGGNGTGVTDLVAEANKIPIKPIQETSELDEEIVDDYEDEEEEQVEKQKSPPQDFASYKLPKVEFLNSPPPRVEQKDEELYETAENLEQKTKEFNVTGKVVNIGQGPVVTTYEFKPDPGVKYSRVTNLVDDLCLALEAEAIRIERIPGKAFVGIEVPNKEREIIYLQDIIDSKEFRQSKSLLTLALGKRIDGKRQVVDLGSMPHLLIAGATGAGKSVGVNSLIVSILYKAKPDEVKFIMVDPKRLELGVYGDIPHLATPIITDPKRAAISLKWAVGEMEKRYKELAGWGVRNIKGFNEEVERKNKLKDFDEDGNPHEKLHYLVIIIDELADLMMVSGKEVEISITRLAQMARAVGIHLILATQRPSVDVITGLIKANFPSRIAFRVSSKIDSRTIIDQNGAENLLGKGDMLYSSGRLPYRVHGTYVDEKEIRKIVEHIKSQGNPEYNEEITKSEEELDTSGDLPGRSDELFGEALKVVVDLKRASTSQLQRRLRIGYGRAAAILDALVAEGYIGEMDGSKRARSVTNKAYEVVQEMEEGREFL